MSNIKFDYNEKNNINSKTKFITRTNPIYDTHGYWISPTTKSDVIDKETNLITPSINSREKTQVKLSNNFNPKDYNLPYSNNYKDQFPEKNITYYTNKDEGAGRGFGNLDISNNMRQGDASRYDTKLFKQQKEGQQLFDYQFQYLDRNVQDPNHLVMPIPRGGEGTRKQNQLTVNTMRTINSSIDFEERIKTIKFDY
jgi:hypothetical protein